MLHLDEFYALTPLQFIILNLSLILPVKRSNAVKYTITALPIIRGPFISKGRKQLFKAAG